MQVLEHERGWSSEGHNVRVKGKMGGQRVGQGNEKGKGENMKREGKVGKAHNPQRNVVKGRKDMREGNEKYM